MFVDKLISEKRNFINPYKFSSWTLVYDNLSGVNMDSQISFNQLKPYKLENYQRETWLRQITFYFFFFFE